MTHILSWRFAFVTFKMWVYEFAQQVDALYANHSFSAALQEKLRLCGNEVLADAFDNSMDSPLSGLFEVGVLEGSLSWLLSQGYFQQDHEDMGLRCVDLTDPAEILSLSVFGELAPVLPQSDDCTSVNYSQLVVEWASEWDLETRGRILLDVGSGTSSAKPKIAPEAVLSYRMTHFRQLELVPFIAAMCREPLSTNMELAIVACVQPNSIHSQFMGMATDVNLVLDFVAYSDVVLF